jgi:hypothetical protein
MQDETGGRGGGGRREWWLDGRNMRHLGAEGRVRERLVKEGSEARATERLVIGRSTAVRESGGAGNK